MTLIGIKKLLWISAHNIGHGSNDILDVSALHTSQYILFFITS